LEGIEAFLVYTAEFVDKTERDLAWVHVCGNKPDKDVGLASLKKAMREKIEALNDTYTLVEKDRSVPKVFSSCCFFEVCRPNYIEQEEFSKPRHKKQFVFVPSSLK
jgi:hypothetical protein